MEGERLRVSADRSIWNQTERCYHVKVGSELCHTAAFRYHDPGDGKHRALSLSLVIRYSDYGEEHRTKDGPFIDEVR